MFRSEESAKKVLARLGNPAEDKFVSIIGNVGMNTIIVNNRCRTDIMWSIFYYPKVLNKMLLTSKRRS